MPILGQRDMIEALSEAIDDRNHGITVGDRKRAAREAQEPQRAAEAALAS